MAGKIRELLAEDQIVRVIGIGRLPNYKFVDMAAMVGGLDAIWLDQEHGGMDMREIEVAALACRANGLDSFIRLAPTDYATVMRPLEAGVGGILAAQVRSAEQVEQIVRWAKFWPRGHRGINSTGTDSHYGTVPLADYAERANQQTFVGIQIETIDAVEHVRAIAQVPDVDLLFIGPADLAQALGLTGQFDHPRCYDTIGYIAKTCREAGKPWGILARNVEYARRWIDQGCRMLVLGNEVTVIRAGLAATRQTFAALFDGTD